MQYASDLRGLWFDWKVRRELSKLRRRVWHANFGSVHRFREREFAITDGPNFYMMCKDAFVRQIYHFRTDRPDPMIVDGGSNIGVSISYFKELYPQCRIAAFEPDPGIFGLLQENLRRIRMDGVELHNVGLAAQDGQVSFTADNSAGGKISDAGTTCIAVTRLSRYVNAPVDLLKLNIEGQELPVLQELEAAGMLNRISQMIVEYHGWPAAGGGRQELGEILTLLDRNGFRYLVHDFDAETNRTTKPPFCISRDTTWFCLVYAKRID